MMDLMHKVTSPWTAPALNPAPVEYYEKISRAIDFAFRSRQLIRVGEAARLSGLRPKAFSAAFHRLTGLGFPQFALRCRLHGAADHIRTTGLPLKAIAGNWGFTDHSHFYHDFMSHYGCSPQRYRERSRP